MPNLKIDKNSFSLDSTLNCGQLFRWKKHDDWWYGIVDSEIFKVRQNNEDLEFEGVNRERIKHYFRLDDNLTEITQKINKDAFTQDALQKFPGLRIVRQSPWECLISFICSTIKNIPAIKDMIGNLSAKFGKEIYFQGITFYAFPNPSALANATVKELRECRLGFRAERVIATAKIIHKQKTDFESLKKLNYIQSKKTLMELPGVGNKVADCVLLFSLDHLEAFPIDVWMKRVIQKYYSSHFDKKFIKADTNDHSITNKKYNAMSSFARNYFGEYAGYAQEYLFHYIRNQG
jgi:N-glycosylase/DNA lyase